MMNIQKVFRRTFFVVNLILLSGFLSSVLMAENESGQLQVKVILVSKDLSLKPVPKKGFTITNEKTGPGPVNEVTSFSGEFSVELDPGNYKIASDSPLEFEGKQYAWNITFKIASGKTTVLELSNDNAQVEKFESTPTIRAPSNEGKIFSRIKNRVFKVISESGHGSGFLVEAEGLILTNHHVVAQSDYLAVKVDEQLKFMATLIATDNLNDLAIIRINPEVLENSPALNLALDDPENPPVSVGDKVLAVGSPLATETILTSGIVSKIEEGAIYSDVSINPGNSGGPLFNMSAEVVGVNTFGLISSNGPGVSGIIRIHLANPLIEEARKKIIGLDPPSSRKLPVIPDYRFPADQLREKALATKYNARDYHIEAGKIDIQLITPVVLATLEVEGERNAAEFRKHRSNKKEGDIKDYNPGESFYEWRRYAGDYRPVVRIQAIPEITMTAGSAWAVALLGANVNKKWKFKTDFDRMELIRGNTVIEPIFPGRSPRVVSAQAGLDSMEDIGFYGSYDYPPEAFKPNGTVILRVWQQGKTKPKERIIDQEMLNRIWSDFLPYFESIESEG